MTISITVLDSATLRDLRARVFRQQEMTLDEAALPYQLPDWEATIKHYRAQTRALLDELPEGAFEPQPQVAGADVWSAGQIAGHMAMAQIDIFLKRCRASLDLDSGPSASERTDSPDDAHRSRTAALQALDLADRDLDTFFTALPSNTDLARQFADENFGQASIGGLLLILAIHEEDHWGQLGELCA